MIYNLVTQKRAEEDLDDAYEWYEERKEGLGDEFLMEFEECCRRILLFPFAYAVKRKQYHQVQLRRFPFVVIYEVVDTEIIINSVFHTSRNPSKKFRKN